MALGFGKLIKQIFGGGETEQMAETPQVPSLPVIMKCGGEELTAPCKGDLMEQEKIPDEIFASGSFGAGCAVTPSEDTLYAPIDGKVTMIAEACHAIGITTASGMEILLHVGIDTVRMKGQGFTLLVKSGQSVKKGDELLTFSREAIREAGYPDCVVVLLTNPEKFEDCQVMI